MKRAENDRKAEIVDGCHFFSDFWAAVCCAAAYSIHLPIKITVDFPCMKQILLIGLLALCVSQLAAQSAVADSAYIRANFTKREVMIPMRDGIQLFTAIYTPKDGTRKYPVLLNRTPYSCAPYGEKAYKTTFQNMVLARSGYIFVFQDVRGKYLSEGTFMDVRPFNEQAGNGSDEATDTYDAVEWLTKNLPAGNGRVGVYGISYPGFYSTMAILAGHPAIKAVSPQAPVTDWFIGDDFHHNGAFMLMDAFSFYSGFGKARPAPTTKSAQGFSDWNSADNYDFFLQAGALPNFNTRYLHDSIAFWNDLMQHPNYDAWWQARNPRPHLRSIKPAVLTVGGLFDAEDCFGAWQTYQAIEQQNPASASNRIVMGPWAHGGWGRTTGERLGNVVFGQKTTDFYKTNLESKFFEYYLKDAGKMDLPEAYIFETGTNKWTTYPTWPPQNVTRQEFFFHEGGKLSTAMPPPIQEEAYGSQLHDDYISDPNKPVPYTEDVHLRRTREYMTDDQRFAARRPDVLVYKTELLTAPLTVVGGVMADLRVSLENLLPINNKLDADFIVKIIDVFPDTLSGRENGVPLGGYQMLVRGEVFRGRYRLSFEKPEGFMPNTVTQVHFTLPDIAHTFLPGHRLMVQVQSSWFPLVDRNPQQFVNIYTAKDTDFIPVKVMVHHVSMAPSGIILPVLIKGGKE